MVIELFFMMFDVAPMTFRFARSLCYKTDKPRAYGAEKAMIYGHRLKPSRVDSGFNQHVKDGKASAEKEGFPLDDNRPPA